MFLLFSACEPDQRLDGVLECPELKSPNYSLAELHELSGNTVMEIRDSLTVAAVVISNDKYGNMFNELYVQSSAEETTYGLRLELELRDSHLLYPVGSTLLLQLKGLWVRKKYGALHLGKAVSFFGNLSIGRIPYHEIGNYIQAGCTNEILESVMIDIRDLQTVQPNTLVQIEDVEFVDDEIGQSLAEEHEESTRNLIDCERNEIRLLTSGYSDFYDQPIPDANGRITGILLSDSKGPYLRVRSWEDIQFDEARCRIPVEPVTSNSVFISEIADPDNATEARFIEIYNSSDVQVPLEGWQLIRYTNANTEPGSTTDLSGYSIDPQKVFTIASDSLGFSTIYGKTADLEAGKNSAADSNGDDTIVLMDPFGATIDIFGRIGEDGSGTDHEFEDGRALRKPEIIRSNSEFLASEWVIYNDTGAEGTIPDPQYAPEDFSPCIKD